MDKKDKVVNIISRIEIDTPQNLSARVLFAIAKKQKRAESVKSALFGFLALVSGYSLVVTGKMAITQFYSSGTAQVFSLIFSDFKTVVDNFGDYIFSVAESFPAISVIYALLSVGALFVLCVLAINSVKKMESIKIDYIKNGYKHA